MAKQKGGEGEPAQIIPANRLRQRRAARLEESVPTRTCSPYDAGVVVLYQHMNEAGREYDVPIGEQTSFLLRITEVSRAYHLLLQPDKPDEHGYVSRFFLSRPDMQHQTSPDAVSAVLHVGREGKRVTRVSFTKSPGDARSDAVSPQQGPKILRFPR